MTIIGQKKNNFTGLNPEFSTRLQGLIAASGGKLRLNSGFRSHERQQQLWAAALKKYGDPEKADNWVARPGGSHHEAGEAGDLEGVGISREEAFALIKRLAPAFGLHTPMNWEPWHVERIDLDKKSGSAYTKPPADAAPAPEDKFASNAAALGAMFGVDIALPEVTEIAGQAAQPSGEPKGDRVSMMRDALVKAGFSGEGLRLGLAVGLAEGSGPGKRNTNTDKYKSVDRGWWQWNDHWHPEVSDEEADDVYASAKHLYRVTNGGKDWNQWSTFKNGSYKRYLGEVA